MWGYTWKESGWKHRSLSKGKKNITNDSRGDSTPEKHKGPERLHSKTEEVACSSTLGWRQTKPPSQSEPVTLDDKNKSNQGWQGCRGKAAFSQYWGRCKESSYCGNQCRASQKKLNCTNPVQFRTPDAVGILETLAHPYCLEIIYVNQGIKPGWPTLGRRMDKDVVDKHNWVLFHHKEEWNSVIGRQIDRAGNDHIKQDKAGSQR